MAKPLLITAFEPFPGVPENPTETLLRSLAQSDDDVLAGARHLVLPTRYHVAQATLLDALDLEASAVIMTGYSNRATGLTLESRSTSAYLPDRPDSAGYCPVPDDAPMVTRATQVDLHALVDRLSGEGLPAEISDDAGSYVCNHVYHAALGGPCGADGIPGLFVHIPAIAGSPLAETAAGRMSLNDLQKGLGIIARAVIVNSE
ncbi:hypothetical protein [Croceicoccus sediminis]|uniref:pyroglutamyl-peptidase I family protein n=1 Tax=Croceicoccus sediminis TaxID=2571150 RepID=UPI0011834661|nr:hypothetical protein [Croceicoccus sediminis]